MCTPRTCRFSVFARVSLRCRGITRPTLLIKCVEALARITGDIDSALPSLLKDEVPITPIPPSGVRDPIEVDHDIEQTLLIHREPWGSASKSPELTWSLIEKDLQAGHLFELLGGEEKARALWRTKVAAGKFGVVCAEGRKLRLIGDGTVFGLLQGPCALWLPNVLPCTQPLCLGGRLGPNVGREALSHAHNFFTRSPFTHKSFTRIFLTSLSHTTLSHSYATLS